MAVISISIAPKLAQAVDDFAIASDQTRSELIRSALRDYLVDAAEDHARFADAYKSTRKEKTISLSALKKKYQLT